VDFSPRLKMLTVSLYLTQFVSKFVPKSGRLGQEAPATVRLQAIPGDRQVILVPGPQGSPGDGIGWEELRNVHWGGPILRFES
jgi:hypothetical protein